MPSSGHLLYSVLDWFANLHNSVLSQWRANLRRNVMFLKGHTVCFYLQVLSTLVNIHLYKYSFHVLTKVNASHLLGMNDAFITCMYNHIISTLHNCAGRNTRRSFYTKKGYVRCFRASSWILVCRLCLQRGSPERKRDHQKDNETIK